MSRNSGRFISRETDTYWNGDRAITDTFMLDDGSLVYHTYNVTADGKAHSHQIMDEYGRHRYARAISEDPNHPWIELDRMNAIRWLSTLSQDKLTVALDLMNREQLHAVSDMICAYQQANIETIEPTKKCVDNRRILCKIYLKII